MPPGNARTQLPDKVVERVTVEAFLAIARQVQHSRQMAGDLAGAAAAKLVATVIREELLSAGRGDPAS